MKSLMWEVNPGLFLHRNAVNRTLFEGCSLICTEEESTNNETFMSPKLNSPSGLDMSHDPGLQRSLLLHLVARGVRVPGAGLGQPVVPADGRGGRRLVGELQAVPPLVDVEGEGVEGPPLVVSGQPHREPTLLPRLFH